MIQTLAPREAAALIAAGGLDVIDVRDSRDWASGHLPGARSVPLEDLRAEPRAALPRDKILGPPMACRSRPRPRPRRPPSPPRARTPRPARRAAGCPSPASTRSSATSSSSCAASAACPSMSSRA
ncbi:MAG: rhodanese-like domain-containing protein [Deltaproteobacteria bacterium]|nr:rhodanese-like domain-containing protein [Deltaproteobacteria bacterium]